MKTTKYQIVFSLFILLSLNTFSQKDHSKIKFGDIKTGDFAASSYGVDSSASAVFLADVGSTNFVGNKSGWFNYVFKRITRIRILNKNGYNAATWNIELYKNNNEAEILSDIKAATYNVENGKVVVTNLDDKSIFEVNADKNHLQKKFTLPDIKEGSIIEVSYTITSPFIFNLPSWLFQNTDFPRLWSEYQVAIPGTLNYFLVKHGFDSFFVKKNWQTQENFSVNESTSGGYGSGGQEQNLSVSTPVSYYKWVMKDVPALKIEDYISSPRNYVDEMEFQLASIYNGESTESYYTNWNKASQSLLGSSDFGAAMQEDVTTPEIEKITENSIDKLNIASDIYYYIKDNFTCTNYNNFFVNTDLQAVVKNRHGSVGEINLLLINRLRKYGISADPVILSTRDHGFSYSKYPIISKFNYLICRVNINGNTYYLDATHGNLGFGNITNNCYNGAGVVITSTPEAVEFSADSLFENKQTIVSIVNNPGGMTGNFSSNLGYIESFNIRSQLAKLKQEDFFKKIKESYSLQVELNNTSIDSLNMLEKPVSIKYGLKFSLGDDDIIYFNPMLEEGYKDNPLKSENRVYPVEMSYCTDELFVLNMEIPNGYVIDELPKSVIVNLNVNDGSFEYRVGKTNTNIQLKCRLKLNKANFAPEDYENIRDFFSFIVKKEAEQIVFKKVK